MHVRVLSSILRPAALLAVLAAAPAAHGQVPGLPVLQNAFGNPGFTAAFDYGNAKGASAYVAAASYGAGRLLLSGGVGALVPDSGGSRATYGARVAMPLVSFMGGALGVAAFAGAGGHARSGESMVEIPVGAGLGWRHAIGASRGVSVYATPMYAFYRASGGGASTSAGLFRASLGADLAITRRLGVTVGVESGAKAAAGDPGPTGTIGGIGVAWAFGAR